MGGKTALVTGANSGIGYHTALGLAKAGARVLVHARREEAGQQAVDEIRAETGNEAVELVLADLASQEAVRGLAKEVIGRVENLHVLVNNAGAVLAERTVSEDGHEAQFAVNHLAPFLLTHELLGLLQASTPSRIVNVASEAHHNVSSIPDDFESLEGRYRSFQVYSQTKLYNLLFTKALARRLAGTRTTVNCLHPGVIGSRFGNEGPWFVRAFMSVARPFLKSPEQGAGTSLYLATSPDVADVSGAYFAKCERKTPSDRARDEQLQEALWAASVASTDAGSWPAPR